MPVADALLATCQQLAAYDSTALLVVGGAFALYRRAFHHLPLHMDTAFYVPNAAVARPRWGTFTGWNAYFSGGSRLLPQLVRTALYRSFGGASYASSFRWLYALMVFASAIGASLLARRLGVQSVVAIAGALIAYLAMASETQYGVFFEAAETFQVLFQVWGVVCCLAGVDTNRIEFVCLGIGLLWLDAILVKLTGAAAAVLVSAAVVVEQPALGWWVVLEATVALALFWALHKASGQSWRQQLQYLKRHESYVRRNYRSKSRLMLVKVAFVGRLMLRNPAIPLLAFAGLLVAAKSRHYPAKDVIVVAAYAVAVAAAFFRQGHRVWYYVVPALPLVSVGLATFVQWAATNGSTAHALALSAAACLCSLLVNLLPRLWGDASSFTHWVFSVYNRGRHRIGDEMAHGDLAIMRAAPALREQIAGDPTFVLGPFNQAYVLIGASYDTPIATACDLSEGTAGRLDVWLPQAETAPPRFVLDTKGVYEHYLAQLPWLRRYRSERVFEGMRLFELDQEHPSVDAAETEQNPRRDSATGSQVPR